MGDCDWCFPAKMVDCCKPIFDHQMVHWCVSLPQQQLISTIDLSKYQPV